MQKGMFGGKKSGKNFRNIFVQGWGNGELRYKPPTVGNVFIFNRVSLSVGIEEKIRASMPEKLCSHTHTRSDFCTRSRNRTGTRLLSLVFETNASTYSAIRA